MRRVRQNHRKAFTLAELLVVVAILAIIAAVGILQLGNARKDLQVKANDSNAKLIYLAAQNQLLQMKEFGQWGALLSSESDENGLDRTFFGSSLAEPGHAQSFLTEMTILGEEDLEEPALAPQKPSDYDAFYASEGSPNVLSWDAVQNDMRVAEYMPNEGATKSGVIARMLPLGTVEDGVRTMGRYIIEYDARTASVYGVFYTEDDSLDYVSESFRGAFYGNAGNGRPYGDYSTGGSSVNGISEASARRVRRDFTDGESKSILGYFGGSMAYGLDYTPLEIPDVRIDNGEDLILRIKDFNNTSETPEKADIQIIVADNHGGSVIYDIRYNGSGYSTKGSLSTVNLVRSSESDADSTTYEIVLDSITPGDNGENYHFANNFCNAENIPGNGTGVIAGDDIKVTVLVRPHIDAASTLVALPVSRTVETNSLFAAAKMNKDCAVTNVTVTQLRHLENVYSAISGAEFANDEEETKLQISFEHSVSFDGKGSGLLPVVPKDYTDKTITDKNGKKFAGFGPGSYIPVSLDSGISPKVIGNRNNVYNIGITLTGSAGKTTTAGLFGSVTKIMIFELGIVSSEMATLEESAKVKTVFSGKADAMGAFVGNAGGNVVLNGCWSTVQLHSGNVTEDTCIGGLVGNAAGEVSISTSYVSGATKEKGMFAADPTEANISVYINNANVNVGGLVGNCGVAKIQNSYCSADIGLSTVANPGQKEYRVGGLVGNAAGGVSITESYFAGWMNMPVSIEPRTDTVLYGGFIGDGWLMSKPDDRSFWIKEFLGISNLPENEVNYTYNDYGLLLEDALALGSKWPISWDCTFPYDNTLLGENGKPKDYPYPYVAGNGGEFSLKHHWGDWCVSEPPIGLFFIAGTGINTISAKDDRPDFLEQHEPYNLTGVVFTAVPANELCDLAQAVNIVYKDGFIETPIYYRNGTEPIAPYDSAHPETTPVGYDPHSHDPLQDGHHYYVTTGKTAVIYVRAEGLQSPIAPPGVTLTGLGNVEKVFNHEETTITPQIATSYDGSVTVRKILAYSFSQNALPTDIEKNTDNTINVKLPGSDTFTPYAPSNTSQYLIDTSLDPNTNYPNNPFAFNNSSYQVAKDEYYGTVYFRLFVYAYCDEDVVPGVRPPLYSAVVDDEFSITLKRVEVHFLHETGTVVGGNWEFVEGSYPVGNKIEDEQNQNIYPNVDEYIRYYIEYENNSGNAGNLYSGTGSSYLQYGNPAGVFSKSPGSAVNPPEVKLTGYYGNGFGLGSFNLRSEGNSKAIYSYKFKRAEYADERGVNNVHYYEKDSLYSGIPFGNDNKIFKPTVTAVAYPLHPNWGYNSMEIGLKPNGGYWEDPPAQQGGGT